MAQTDNLRLNYEAILSQIGEQTDREGLMKTPERAAKAFQFLTQGYAQDPVVILRSAMFRQDYSEMVLVKDIELYSLCEHHLLPFFGKAHVAYIPDGYIVGLSKIPRVVDVFARRLQVQERLTMQIAAELRKALRTEDVAVYIDAKHMCVQARGVEHKCSSTVTSDYSGRFLNEQVRAEFLQTIR